MYLNGDGIQVLHMPAAHSDGDSVVFFRRADVIVTGDILDTTRFPVIDVAKGGSIQGEIDALNRLVDMTIPPFPLGWREDRTYVIPGHGFVCDYADLVEYRNMVTIMRDRIQDMVDRGMTLEQVKAADPAKGFRRRYGAELGAWTTDMFVEAVYRGLAEAEVERAGRRVTWRAGAGLVARSHALRRLAARHDGAATRRRRRRCDARRRPIDLTGYWVSVVTQDWRWRMVTPAKGDYASIPITLEAKKVGDAWDPAKDEAAGEQCKSYGAPALMAVPTRLRIAWQDENTLKVETDAGTQTRRFHFGDVGQAAGRRPATWQGDSIARMGKAAPGPRRVAEGWIAESRDDASASGISAQERRALQRRRRADRILGPVQRNRTAISGSRSPARSRTPSIFASHGSPRSTSRRSATAPNGTRPRARRR